VALAQLELLQGRAHAAVEDDDPLVHRPYVVALRHEAREATGECRWDFALLRRGESEGARLAPLEPEATAPVAGVEGPGEAADEAPAAARVGVPGRFALAGEAGDHQRLGAAELLDPGF